MARITWGELVNRRFEKGVRRGVLYVDDDGVPWNGLTSVNEQPSGAEASPQYADDILYVNLTSAELYGATIEAFTYPVEFEECLGNDELGVGVWIAQQDRKNFGFSFTNTEGNASDPDYDEVVTIVYGAAAAPSERAHNTVNESPELAQLSFTITTTPVPVEGKRPTSRLRVRKSDFDAGAWDDFLDVIYGSAGDDARLPTPVEVNELLNGTVTDVNLLDEDNQPDYDDATHILTVPAVTGVIWTVDGEAVANGAQPALSPGEIIEVKATPASASYNIVGDDTSTFIY